MRSIAPGEELTYEFTTDYAGVWMYHCGTDPVLHHIANGMFAMVIVEPEGGMPPMENEFFIVQHEWYPGPQGEVSSYTEANQAAPAPDFVMFNGATFPAQGAVIEPKAAEDGLYPMVTHAFNFPGRGAVGLLQAGDGEP